MANKFQAKRTSVTGRTPNTSSSSNAGYIDAGEFALNLIDGKLFSSNGSAYFEVGANLVNQNITNNVTVSNVISTKIISANSSSQTKAVVSISSSSITLDLNQASVFEVTLNSDITTVTINNVQTSGNTSSFVLGLIGDGTPRSVTWPASFNWPGGTAPTLTSTSNKKDFITAFTYDGGTDWYAFISGQNL